MVEAIKECHSLVEIPLGERVRSGNFPDVRTGSGKEGFGLLGSLPEIEPGGCNKREKNHSVLSILRPENKVKISLAWPAFFAFARRKCNQMITYNYRVGDGQSF